ncbi:hypothetical protein GCM10023231_39500 [Olivibacter ginsenosidimutans]|uniref:Uncharacterized protein n=1 Tax=Olivibacter ginsenosidimutans TaxID=1176537 RepID=A0ABP9C8D8_9SPHI
MAINDKKGHVHGKIGPLVYRSSKGQQIVQSLPRKFKQTTSTKLTGHEFGLASTISATMRRVIGMIIDQADSKMAYRFTGMIRQCLHHSEKSIGERDLHDVHLSDLRGFQFNLDAPFERVLKKSPVSMVDEQGVLRFELDISDTEKDFAFVQRNSKIIPAVKITSIAFDFRQNTVQTIDYQEFKIPDHQPYTIRYTSNKNLPTGSIMMILMSLHYYTNGWLTDLKPVHDPRYNAAGILHAFHVTDRMTEKGDRELFIPLGESMPIVHGAAKKLHEMHQLIIKEKERQHADKKAKDTSPRLIYAKRNHKR